MSWVRSHMLFYLTIKTCWKFLLHITSRFHTTFPQSSCYSVPLVCSITMNSIKISLYTETNDLEERRINVQFAFYDYPFCRYIKSQKLFCLLVLKKFSCIFSFWPISRWHFVSFKVIVRKTNPISRKLHTISSCKF